MWKTRTATDICQMQMGMPQGRHVLPSLLEDSCLQRQQHLDSWSHRRIQFLPYHCARSCLVSPLSCEIRHRDIQISLLSKYSSVPR